VTAGVKSYAFAFGKTRHPSTALNCDQAPELDGNRIALSEASFAHSRSAKHKPVKRLAIAMAASAIHLRWTFHKILASGANPLVDPAS
jgi:hypothetical protein